MLGLTRNAVACRRQWRIGELRIGRPSGGGDLIGVGLDKESRGLLIGTEGCWFRERISQIESAEITPVGIQRA
jgi:hypothetical protein